MRQGGIGGFQRHVGSAAHGDTNGGGLHCRRVINPVTDHRQRRSGIERRDRLHFIGRQQPGTELQPQFPGNGGSRPRVITGQNYALHPQTMQIVDRLTGVVSQRILQRQNAEQRLFAQYQHNRLTRALQLLNLRLMLCGGVVACRANQYLTTVDLGFNARTRQCALTAGRRNRQLALLGFAHDGLRQRVAGALFHCRRQRQQVIFIHVIQGDGGGDARLADG